MDVNKGGDRVGEFNFFHCSREFGQESSDSLARVHRDEMSQLGDTAERK